jgi:hypothetical protein
LGGFKQLVHFLTAQEATGPNQGVSRASLSGSFLGGSIPCFVLVSDGGRHSLASRKNIISLLFLFVVVVVVYLFETEFLIALNGLKPAM